jgi:hypothetical protein
MSQCFAGCGCLSGGAFLIDPAFFSRNSFPKGVGPLLGIPKPLLLLI